jgi:hypothetical protein
MQARRDDLKDSFYLHIMRTSIGAGLRNQYAPNGRLPDRLAELLRELDQPKDQVAEKKQSMRKRAQEG